MKRLILIFLFFATTAQAQQATPETEALIAKLMTEINSGITCNTGTIMAKREIEKLQSRIKELETKIEKKE